MSAQFYKCLSELLKIYLLLLGVFMIFRVVFLCSYTDLSEIFQNYKGDLIKAFWVGFRCDTIVLCFSLTPLLLLNLSGFLCFKQSLQFEFKRTPHNAFLESNPPNIVVVLMEGWSSDLFNYHSKSLNLLGALEDERPSLIFYPFCFPVHNGTIAALETFITNNVGAALSISNYSNIQLKSYNPYPLNLPDSLQVRATKDLQQTLSSLQTFQYANDCLGRFLNDLRNSPLGENTIVAITGDHAMTGGFSYKESELLYRWAVPLAFLITQSSWVIGKMGCIKLNSHYALKWGNDNFYLQPTERTPELEAMRKKANAWMCGMKWRIIKN